MVGIVSEVHSNNVVFIEYLFDGSHYDGLDSFGGWLLTNKVVLPCSFENLPMSWSYVTLTLSF